MPWGDCVKNGVATLACIPAVISNIVNFIIMFSGIVAVFFIALAGYKFVTSQGDPQRLDSARKTFFYSIAGLIFIALAFFVLQMISVFTGVKMSTLGFTL